MPYPNEHSARIHDPKNYKRFTRQNNKFGEGIHAIWGIKDDVDETVELQAIRFDSKKYTATKAKQWCKEHDYKYILFEPAEDKDSMNSEIEVRNFDIIEMRVEKGEDDKPSIKGYAAVFNKLSEDLGGFREQIAPGAFKNTIGKDDIRALWNHDPNYVLGRNKSGTLKLEEDDRGLLIKIDPPDAQWARDLMKSIERGDITQMSFGFRAIKDEWKNESGKMPIRTLLENWLRDISPVTFPAYPQTSVKVRDYLNALDEAEEEPDRQGLAPKEGAEASLARQRLNYSIPKK